MNESSLADFRKEIKLIRKYIQHIQDVNDIAGYVALKTDNEQIKKLLDKIKGHNTFGIDKKIFEYKAIIISLYGILEKFIEIWIKEYLDTLSDIIPKYNQIDNKIKEQHFELSLKLISTITSRTSAKYQHLTKEQVLKNLNNCIENPSDYIFNLEAFVLLSGNLKHNKIVELFKQLNIDLNGKLKINQTIIQHIQYIRQKEDIGELKAEVLYEEINQLVESRNEIAHGSETVENFQDHSVLESYIQFLENYCQAIFEILNEEIIKHESIHKFQKIENVIDIFDNKILAFEIENYELKLGDFIIIETAEDKFFKKPILEIQVDNKSCPKIKITGKTNIAVQLEPTIKKNQKFFIAKKNN